MVPDARLTKFSVDTRTVKVLQLTDTRESALGGERLELGGDGSGGRVAVTADEVGDQASDVGGGLRGAGNAGGGLQWSSGIALNKQYMSEDSRWCCQSTR